VEYGDTISVWKKWIQEFDIENVYCNRDYEPYAIKRDKQIHELLQQNNIDFYTLKDQCIFEYDEVLKDDGKPYTVYTP
jgi:deoxyribodipyrimidine photo-lyase